MPVFNEKLQPIDLSIAPVVQADFSAQENFKCETNSTVISHIAAWSLLKVTVRGDSLYVPPGFIYSVFVDSSSLPVTATIRHEPRVFHYLVVPTTNL